MRRSRCEPFVGRILIEVKFIEPHRRGVAVQIGSWFHFFNFATVFACVSYEKTISKAVPIFTEKTSKETPMKNIIMTVCLAVLGFGLSGCVSHPQMDHRQAITAVLAQKESAGVSCARILIDEQQIANVQLHGVEYLHAIEKIDVTRCPEPFRTAWANYCAAWAQKLKNEKANPDTLDLISMWKGQIGDLKAICRSLEAYDTAPAWARCEQVAAECGAAIPQ